MKTDGKMEKCIEKSIENESSEDWKVLGEKSFKDNLRKANDSVAKSDVTRKIINAILPPLHLIRSEVVDGELVDSLAKNFEIKTHSLYKNFMEGIGTLKDVIDKSDTKVVNRVDGLQRNNTTFHNHVTQSLNILANNQREIVGMVGQFHGMLAGMAAKTSIQNGPSNHHLGGPSVVEDVQKDVVDHHPRWPVLPDLSDLPCPSWDHELSPEPLVRTTSVGASATSPTVPQPGTRPTVPQPVATQHRGQGTPQHLGNFQHHAKVMASDTMDGVRDAVGGPSTACPGAGNRGGALDGDEDPGVNNLSPQDLPFLGF